MWDWSILSVGNNDFFVNWAGIIDFKEILITFNVGGFIFYGIRYFWICIGSFDIIIYSTFKERALMWRWSSYIIDFLECIGLKLVG